MANTKKKNIKKVVKNNAVADNGKFMMISLADLSAHPENARTIFSGQKYDELRESVKQKGVVVPILVRPIKDAKTKYQIVYGERRWRVSCDIAKKNGGVKKATIPAIVKNLSDDDAFDLMTIENLQREDLTPLEEAKTFMNYLNKRGAESLPDLAERIGINPSYIRRRTAVLSLPEEILAAWEGGKIAFGHLEQLVRVDDPVSISELFELILDDDYSVNDLKHLIDRKAAVLSEALFSLADAGCLECSHNTDVQISLLGEGIAEKAKCTDPACFRNNQNAWLSGNWTEFKAKKKISANGFIFDSDLNHGEFRYIFGKKPECKKCENLKCSLYLDGKVQYKEICDGNADCYVALYDPKPEKVKKDIDPNTPRVPWHGEYFREEFYKTRVPELMTSLPSDDDKVLRVLLLSVLETHSGTREVFKGKCGNGNNEVDGYVHFSIEEAWQSIENLQNGELKALLHNTALHILMDPRTTHADTRRKVAMHLGSDLASEWQITKEYLEKKTTKEIHDIASRFELFKDEKAQAYLYETLGKKRGRFDLCKKGELVKVILESGVDLSGKVPDEILK